MALVNMFGKVALEDTQLDIKLEHGEILMEVLLELRKINMHLAHMTDQHITDQDVEDTENVY